MKQFQSIFVGLAENRKHFQRRLTEMIENREQFQSRFKVLLENRAVSEQLHGTVRKCGNFIVAVFTSMPSRHISLWRLPRLKYRIFLFR
jgi:acyl transferase domain-containing protein